MSEAADSTRGVDRRAFMASMSAMGLSATALPVTLWAEVKRAKNQTITAGTISEAAKISGLEFTEDEIGLMVDDLNGTLDEYERLREVLIPNSVVPAIHFEPALPWNSYPMESTVFRYTRPQGLERPSDLEELAFWPVTHLAELIRTRQVTSVELTQMYLSRLAKHGPTLECVVTITEDLAMRQAARADAELARGHYRGPLHGIPWGAKDLLAEDSYATTWGAKPYEDQHIPDDSTVGRRLEEAGAVLLAKLTLGALAQGDRWFGGRTNNPWHLEQGSSGSSAGSASATVAGLVGFSIGSETLGSIVSPSTRCGASGLRPTFGRVSRAGAMTLSWSMDKLGAHLPQRGGLLDCAASHPRCRCKGSDRARCRV